MPILTARRALLGATAAALASPALAQSWPSHPFRLLVGFPPASMPDLTARIYAPGLAERLGQQVVVENRSGAGGALAGEALMRAAPDGQTLLMMSQYLPVLPAIQRNVSFDVGNVLPLAGTAQASLVLLVPPSLGVTDLAGFLDLARGRGQALAFGHSGLAGAPSLAMALLMQATGIAPLAVGYRGEPEIISGLLTGAVQCGFGFVAGASAQIRAGRLIGLGITAPERATLLREVPTMPELGLPTVQIGAWWALAVPRATPADAQRRLTEATQTVRATPNVVAGLQSAGAQPLALDGAALLAFNEKERNRQLELFQRLGVKPE